MITNGMGACIIGDGRNLTLDTGDGAYIMHDIAVAQWNMSITCGTVNISSFDDVWAKSVGVCRDARCTIEIMSNKVSYSPDSIPRKIETYSITDMLNMINAKLLERDNA